MGTGILRYLTEEQRKIKMGHLIFSYSHYSQTKLIRSHVANHVYEAFIDSISSVSVDNCVRLKRSEVILYRYRIPDNLLPNT
jgi:hypothetical protein